jgi:hypothetical protein
VYTFENGNKLGYNCLCGLSQRDCCYNSDCYRKWARQKALRDYAAKLASTCFWQCTDFKVLERNNNLETIYKSNHPHDIAAIKVDERRWLLSTAWRVLEIMETLTWLTRNSNSITKLYCTWSDRCQSSCYSSNSENWCQWTLWQVLTLDGAGETTINKIRSERWCFLYRVQKIPPLPPNRN